MTRVEDRAYSLMGLLDVNIPMLYATGEGKKLAFRRLQLEITRSSNDQNIFAWGYNSENVRVGNVLVLKSHMHLMQYVDQVCIICSSVKVTLCPLTSSVDGVCTCTTPSTHISVDLVIVL